MLMMARDELAGDRCKRTVRAYKIVYFIRIVKLKNCTMHMFLDSPGFSPESYYFLLVNAIEYDRVEFAEKIFLN